jgi:L-alanine-DL-glutamate epimerase-like enolase superfamily enzyme
MRRPENAIRDVKVSAFTVPTETPEADGTLSWNQTTLVVAEITAADKTGLGYTYGHKAVRSVAETLAQKCLKGQSAFDIPALHTAMRRQVRNDGSRGIPAMAISALDVALWDLKAQLLGCSVSSLLGKASAAVHVYGSGGFTSYSDEQLRRQLHGWVANGIRSVKMKIGDVPGADPARVKSAREAIGPDTRLYVDANGAYTATQALRLADTFAEQNVVWFEEPVSSDYREELHFIRERLPHGMQLAAGEYGYDALYFRRLLEAQAVDILQADATRCGGYTGFLEAAAIARSYGIPLSAHCAPTLHMHVACAVPGFFNIEYFFDHARIEQMFFDGFVAPQMGMLAPDDSRPGLGIVLKQQDAMRFAA